jgi:hypothetical protein
VAAPPIIARISHDAGLDGVTVDIPDEGQPIRVGGDENGAIATLE